MQDTTQLDPTMLQNLIGGSSTPNLIPESLVTTLTVGFIVLNVLGVLFFMFYVISLIRKWKVESAVLKMQKDLAEIKSHLAGTPVNAPAEPYVQPAQSNQIIAQADSPDADKSSGNPA